MGRARSRDPRLQGLWAVRAPQAGRASAWATARHAGCWWARRRARREDQRGEPFVGQAGRLLDNMLAAIGLKRGEDADIAMRSSADRHTTVPERGEIAARQRRSPIARSRSCSLQPLVALGRPAAQAPASIGRDRTSAARGKRFERVGTPVVVTYHPAHLLRNPQDKAKAREDLVSRAADRRDGVKAAAGCRAGGAKAARPQCGRSSSSATLSNSRWLASWRRFTSSMVPGDKEPEQHDHGVDRRRARSAAHRCRSSSGPTGSR